MPLPTSILAKATHLLIESLSKRLVRWILIEWFQRKPIVLSNTSSIAYDNTKNSDGAMTEPHTDQPDLKRKSDQTVRVSKRRPSLAGKTKHPNGGRLLALPSSMEELEVLNDCFSDNNCNNRASWRLRCLDRVPRPLPSTHVLVASYGRVKSSEACPILDDFKKAVGWNPSEKEEANKVGEADGTDPGENNVQGFEASSPSFLESIDDSSSSILTIRQHRRYLDITNRHQTDARTEKQRQELRKLKALVAQDQQTYRNALDQFFQKYSSRFLIGFQASTVSGDDASKVASNETLVTSRFARFASQMSKLANKPYEQAKSEGVNQVNPIPFRFGYCRQVISLQLPTRTTSARRPLLDVDSLTFERLHSTDNKTSQMERDGIPTAPYPIPLPLEELVPARHLLHDDDKARKLAIKHNASIITSHETLEAMLQLPGEYSAKWMTYVKITTATSTSNHSQRLCILDLPISQSYVSPRQCLEAGLEEGLYQCLGNGRLKLATSPNCIKGTPNVDSVRYIYTLWKLPKLSTSKRQLSVLVRSAIRLCNEQNDCPVKVRVHVDYFPERGKEIFSSYERALWILDQLLLGAIGDPMSAIPLSEESPVAHVISMMARVDPSSCHVREWENVSVAHAFNEDSDYATTSFFNMANSNHHIGPMAHWHVLVQLLQSIPTIDDHKRSDSDFLLCLPGRGDKSHVPKTAVSVHAAECELKVGNSSSVSTHARAIPASAEKKQLQRDDGGTDTAAGRNRGNVAIDLETMVFPNSVAVQLNSDALRFDCQRDWKWNHDGRIPYTSPPQQDVPKAW